MNIFSFRIVLCLLFCIQYMMRLPFDTKDNILTESEYYYYSNGIVQWTICRTMYYIVYEATFYCLTYYVQWKNIWNKCFMELFGIIWHNQASWWRMQNKTMRNDRIKRKKSQRYICLSLYMFIDIICVCHFTNRRNKKSIFYCISWIHYSISRLHLIQKIQFNIRPLYVDIHFKQKQKKNAHKKEENLILLCKIMLLDSLLLVDFHSNRIFNDNIRYALQ